MIAMEPNYYFYKMTADNGGAPCIQNGLLSLAICKPMIRSTAKKDDIIFGFACDTLYTENALVYIACITEKLCKGVYYAKKDFADRADCIYQPTKNYRYKLKSNSAFHQQVDMEHDIGIAPKYSRANVLLSEDYRYFGGEKNPVYKSKYSWIAKSIKKLMQGHRVNHSTFLRNELIELKDQIWNTYSQTVTDIPVIPDNPNKCTPMPERSGRSCAVC